jgi:hypothetical protein
MNGTVVRLVWIVGMALLPMFHVPFARADDFTVPRPVSWTPGCES